MASWMDYLAGTASSPEEVAQAQADLLGTESAQRKMLADKERAGLLFSLSRDKHLAPMGQALIQGAGQGQIALGKYDASMLHSAILARRATETNRHNQMGEAATEEKIQQPNYGDVRTNSLTGEETQTEHKSGRIKVISPGAALGGAGGGGRGGGGGDGGGMISPEALIRAATTYHTTGKTDGVGRNPALKAAILNKEAELFPRTDISGNHSEYMADQKSLGGIQKQADNIKAFENTAVRNLDLLLETGHKVIDRGSPLFNKGPREFGANVLGNPDLAAFKAAHQSVVGEVGKVLSGTTGGSAGLSDTARKEVQGLLNENASMKQLEKAAEILRREMKNRTDSLDSQVNEIRDRRKKASTPEGQKSEDKVSTYNPVTGKLE